MAEGDPTNPEKPELKIGSYRLIEQLGSGGMSSVYRAVHDDSGNQVAVKILPRSLAKNPTMLQRFLREAKSAEALEHPNIVSIYDRGVDQGRHYLVLEYVEGGDLHDRVRNEGPLEIGEAVGVIRSVAEGLKYASERGLIHRDIKPANLLLSPSGEVKIIDLGLALKAEAEDERVTRDGTTVGTVDYMSPEQARDSRATSERSDIYSLGCTFYYLLTGSPPFPGGDIADKLSRHCTKPPPDPCEARPSVPKALGAVVRKMMAKRPENRYQNHAELLAALRSGPLGELGPGATPGAGHGGEESDDGIPLAPLESGVTGALVAGKARTGDPGGSAPHGVPLNLADLAEAEDEPAQPARRRTSGTPHSNKAPAARKEQAAADAPEDEPDLEEEGYEDDELVEDLGAGRAAPAVVPAAQTATLKWVYGGIGGAVALLLLVVIINLLLPSNKPIATEPVPEESQPVEAPIAPEPAPPPAPAPPPVAVVGAAPSAPAPAPAPRPAPAAPGLRGAPPGRTPVAPTTALTKAAPAAPPWVEPADPAPERVAETPVSAAVAARFALPAWAKTPIPRLVPGTLLKVRRIPEPSKQAEERAALSAAFEAIGSGTTELIDNGPFADSDFRLRGDVRLLKAGEGRRPIIRLEHPKLDIIRDQGAIFVVEGKQLILDGIDLIVDLQDLPREHKALFWCKGGSLTLHNCTVTIINPQNYPFSVIRAQGTDRPAQVRVENCFLRGSTPSMIELAGGVVEVAVVRSVLVGGQRPLIVSTTTAPGGERKLHVQHSVLASRGAFLELTSPVGARPTPVSVRALASSLARFRGDESASLIFFHDDVGGEAKDYVNWQGEHNVFMGWNDWASMGNAHEVKVASLAAARTAWPGTDAQSQELPSPWPLPPDANRVLPEQMRRLAPQTVATLVTIPPPSAYIFEKAIEEFKRPELPTYVSPIPNEVQEGQPFVPAPGAVANFQPPPAFAPPQAPADPNAPPTVAVKELHFDVMAKPWSGNLGIFLHEQIKPGDARVKVRVTGSGPFYFTPVVIPEGTSLEVLVETARQAGGTPPEWYPYMKGKVGDVLIDVKGGDLVLTGVEIMRDGGAQLKALVRTQDGHLVLNHCRFQHKARLGALQKNGGNLIIFNASTTRPLPDHPWPFDKPFDKPVCRILDSVLITPGDVLSTNLGRGVISLSECAISGGNVFVLDPARVARSRFEADLSIERCTIAAERSFVTLGPWPGTTPGPDRPWLVSSRDTAYMASFSPVRESVLLKVEPNSLAQGTLMWQGNNDAYEVINFTARADGRPVTMNAHPDVYRQWTSLWGANHFRSATGPTSRSGSTVRLLEKLRPGNVTPGELALDKDDHPGRSELNLGVDLHRLQVSPGPERPGGARRKQ